MSPRAARDGYWAPAYVMRFAASACALFLLAPGCRASDPAVSPPAPAPVAGSRAVVRNARSGGVEFRASGNEPGWTLEILADRLVFVGNYGAERATTPRPAPHLESGETVYAAVTEAHRLTVRIRPTPCADSMSGERYDANVEVELDGRRYRGCGGALTAP